MKTRTVIWLLISLIVGGAIFGGLRLFTRSSNTPAHGWFRVDIEALNSVPLGGTMKFRVTILPANNVPYAYMGLILDPGVILVSDVPTRLLDLKRGQAQRVEFSAMIATQGEQRIAVSVGQENAPNGVGYLWLYSSVNGTEVRTEPRPRPMPPRNQYLVPLDQMPTSKPTATR